MWNTQPSSIVELHSAVATFQVRFRLRISDGLEVSFAQRISAWDYSK
jgi:hypothetical protein